MLAQVHFPQTVLTDELDRYLAEGWFRMGQTIFSTNFLNFNKSFYSAVWLRIVLSECGRQQSFEKLKKLNSKFRISFQPASVTDEKEILFSRYRREISFEASPSIGHLLFGREHTDNVYRTLELTIHDGDKLIACGFFDIGKNSAAGISSFYDPQYKKFSLGKYLIFLKIEYCISNGLNYFYPGYFVPGYSAFDYKLKIHHQAQEYLQLSSSKWTSIREFGTASNPMLVMREKLAELQQQLTAEEIRSNVFYYEYYDANLVHDLSHLELFDFPMFVHYYDELEGVINALVVFDVRDQQYHWLIVKSLWNSDVPMTQEDHFASHLLKVEYEVFATASIPEMVAVIKKAVAHAARPL
jgi:arginyl-tRNA--protein-N-Asp/Glu arginylyltransferase